ncbi:5-hydroxytryptamine receptor 7 [Pimephales promelas]|uniref:5-hydroxytryptamine receptor 7 n=1 Tax=Pimephales promelas TaxID=90988 RepID=UPI001955EC98|nr:5-hydroxytryptamine receptor 7 [Pimephales promelas]KAG1970686.1 5-hydroxytryptamine receptor 7-like [Pimephales promelas]
MFTTHGAELVSGSRETEIAFVNGTTEFSPTVLITTTEPKSNESCGEQKTLDLDLTKTVVIGMMLSTITAVTVMGNTLVVIAVCVVKKLRQPSNYLLVSLAIADLSVAVVVMPFAIVTDLTGGVWLFGEVFCNVFIGMDVMCCTASIMNLCVISVDRYLGITRPLTYPARQNGLLMAKMIVGVWLVSASITLPPFCGWAQNVNTAGVCLISQDVGYTLYSTAVAFYIPMVVMLFMYYKIFKAARKSGAKHHFAALPPIQIACPEPVLATVEGLCMQGMKNPAATEEFSTLSCLLNRERQSASIFRREQKAATTLGVIMGIFSICWLPFFLFTTARPFICGLLCSCAPVWLERVLLWLGYTNSLMNPFIYAFFNRDLRSTYKDLLCCRYRNINRRLSAMGVHEALKL